MADNASLQAALTGHSTTYRVLVQEEFAKAAPGEYRLYTQEETGGGATTLTHAVIANTPLLRKWVGARQHKEPRAYTASITYDKYESTLDLKRTDVQYDQSGVVAKMLAQHARATVDFYDRVASTAYASNSDVGPTGMDGVALFSASHPYANSSGGTQSNLSASTNLSHAAILAAETAGHLLTEENGRNMQINFNTLHVGPRLRRRAQELLGADRVVVINQAGTADVGKDGADDVNAASTRSNVLYGDYQIVVDNKEDGYIWTLQDTRRYKPLILFIVRPPEVINRTNMDDPYRFEQDRFLFGVESDVGVGAGYWPCVHRGTGTA